MIGAICVVSVAVIFLLVKIYWHDAQWQEATLILLFLLILGAVEPIRQWYSARRKRPGH